MEINRSKVKTYFIGKSQVLPVLLMVFGVILAAAIIGIPMLIAGIVWFFVNKFMPDLSGESEVDKAMAHELSLAKERALKKLNLIDEQVQNTDPVVVSGRGFEPETPTGVAIAAAGKFAGFFKKFMLKKSDDPVYMTRIGSDSKFRCSLASVTVFMFGETQLYIYFSNIDLTTGLVYSEGTHEYFYSDINAISFLQDREKVFNFKKKKFERVLFESVKVYASGCYYTATLSTDIDHSLVEREFTGMRNLIRDRKNG